MADEHIFRFLSVRPANIKPKIQLSDRKIELYSPKDGQTTELHKIVTEALQQGVTITEMQELAKKFKESDHYVKKLDDLDFKIEEFYKWFIENQDKALKDLKIEEVLKTKFGGKASEIVKTEHFKKSKLKLADSILVDSIDRTGLGEQNAKYLVNLKLFNLISAIADKSLFIKDDNKIGEFVTSSTVIIPDFLNPNKFKKEEEVPPSKPEPPKDTNPEQKKLRDRLKELVKAHKEISLKGTKDKYRYISKAKNCDNSRIESLEKVVSKISKEKKKSDKKVIAVSSLPSIVDHRSNREFIFSLKAVNNFSTETKKVINDYGLEKTEISPIEISRLIEDEVSSISSQITLMDESNSVIALGGAYLDSAKFKSSIGYHGTKEEYVRKIASSCKFQAGIGDLLMVKQTLKAYELAEFAHVENVLAGELRRREHRRLNQREEIFIEEQEVETEKERDLQSTERNELQNEAEKTVRSQFELEAGLQISGSYGPTVSFAASLNTGFSNSTQETQRKASSYSRQVTEKSAEKIREKVREERVRRVLEEIEEINLHEVNNANAANGHIRGIYRWLNKIYDAQVFNYGQRMMFEFIMPEPAAYFLYAMVENAPSEIEIPKPTPPKFGSRNLRPTDLSRDNYSEYVSAYNVVNVPDLPTSFTVVSVFDKQDGNSENNFGRTSKIAIPNGYEAYGATVSYDEVNPEGENRSARIMVGGVQINRTYWGTEYVSFPYNFRGEVAVDLSLMNIRSFAFSVDVFCNLTSDGFAKWQHKMYEAIMESYLQQKAEYDEKIAALEIQKGVQILGRNPLENRRLERDELKKIAIMMLINSPYLYLNSYSGGSGEPILNIERACREGSYIRFFENAFEWNNMMYVFYPYFWGRHSKWINALHLTDPDPEFAAFLKAGAARVQVPVRPGFERAVAHFSQFGQIWEGNDIPLRDDDLYVPIVDEITENLGKLDDGVPYPEDSQPWEVVIPTSLVVLQNLDEIDGIRDTLSGNDIDIQPQQP